MAKHIIKDPANEGKLIDKNDSNKEFKGKTSKDLEIGDRFDVEEKGQNRTFEVKEKRVTEDGILVVRSLSVSL